MGAGNPYVGARPFTAEQRLFGRDRERREIVNVVIAERIVLLHSPSGAGKTSLLQGRGGVIDSLREEGFAVLPVARVGLPRPALPRANRYIESLLASLEQEIGGSATLEETLGRLVAQHAEPIGAVLIIDQLEEILTVDPTGEDERIAFFDALGRALTNRRLWALFALREEYLGALAPYRPRIPTHLRTTYRLDLLDRAAAVEAITQPARDAGVPFTEAAAEKLVRELCSVTVPRLDGTVERKPGTSVEPVQLQIVCHRLWMQRNPAANEISESDINAVESVDAALAEYYASSIARAAQEASVSERRIRAWIERDLITKAGFRSQVMRRGEREEGVPDKAVDSLIDTYILRQDTRRGVDWIELAHDRLLKPIVKSNAAWRREHLNIAQVQATLWEEHGRDEAFCLRGAALQDAERWAATHEGELTPIEEQLLAASRKMRTAERVEKTRQRRRLSIAIVVAVLMGLLGSWAWAKKLEADRQRSAAKESALMDSARELLANNQPALAMKLLLEVRDPEKKQGWVGLTNEVLNASSLKVSLRGHSRVVERAVFSPDSKRIVTASDDTTARIWNADGTSTPIVLRGHSAGITTVEFSPDGKRIVTASDDSTARVWNADGIGTPVVLRGHTDKIVFAVFSRDGTRVVTASQDKTARVWRADGTGEPVVLRGHTDGVRSASFSPDGTRILTASPDGTARVWNADGTGEPIVLRGHREAVRFASFSPDGKRIVTTSSDTTARVWNADGTGEPIILRGHSRMVLYAAWSPDSARVVTVSLDWTARVWNADGRGTPIILAGHTSEVPFAEFSPDGRRIVTASRDRTARVWTADGTGEVVVLRGHDAAVLSVAFSPDGQRIVTASVDNTARVWRVDCGGEPIADVRGPLLDSTSLSPDFRRVTTGFRNATANVWSTDGTGERIVLRGHTDRVRTAVFSPDGKQILTASDDTTARVWNADGTGEPIVLRGHGDAVLSAAFSLDGKRIVTTSADKTARVWNADGTGEPIVLRGHTNRVIFAAFSRDGERIVTGSDDHTARVWRSDGTGEPIVLRGHEAAVRAVAFSADGKRIVTGAYDNKVRIWTAIGSDQSVVLRGHDAAVRTAMFSPDGERIVTGSDDASVRVWSVNGKEEPVIIRAQATSPIALAVFSADGKQIVTMSDDDMIKVWSISIPDLQRRLETANADCLLPEMRSRYFAETKSQAEDRYETCEREHGRVPAASRGR
jgi:WD40 repeat protein